MAMSATVPYFIHSLTYNSSSLIKMIYLFSASPWPRARWWSWHSPWSQWWTSWWSRGCGRTEPQTPPGWWRWRPGCGTAEQDWWLNLEKQRDQCLCLILTSGHQRVLLEQSYLVFTSLLILDNKTLFYFECTVRWLCVFWRPNRYNYNLT